MNYGDIADRDRDVIRVELKDDRKYDAIFIENPLTGGIIELNTEEK